jgi:RHS repeat-associated protein
MLKLTGNSFTGSPLCTLQQGNTVHVAWSPWGTTARHEPAIPGFNGQRTDPITAVTHLGNGYRAYSPALMRFTCPDNLSPFGQGGVNPYVYCESDPVNRSDPSGHFFLISFLASLFSSLAAAAADAAATAAAAVGAEAGIAAGAAAGAEAGVATMTVTEFAAATSVASTSAAFGGTGTALSAGATVAAGATAMATTTTAFATSTAAATLGSSMRRSVRPFRLQG